MKLSYRIIMLLLCLVSPLFGMHTHKKLGFPAALIPIDRLSELGLCPLFPRYDEFQVDGDVIKNMLPVKFKRLGSWETQLVDQEKSLKLMPCMKRGKDFERDALAKQLNTHVTISHRILMQLKAVNQNSTPEGTAMCAGLALRNSVLMYDFARFGKVEYLKQLPDMALAQQFLEQNGCVRWVNPEQFPSWVEKVGMAKESFSVIPTVFALDERYHKEPLIAYGFTETELRAMLDLRRKISEGLKSDQFFHTFVIGDYEVAQRTSGRGHYFSFSIFKVGTMVQYVIADTQVENYHLRQATYEYARILYLIDLLETGASAYGTPPPLDLYRDTPWKKE